MSNSSLVTYTKISPNKTSPRNHAIDTITIHCYVGQVTAERGCSGRRFVKYNPIGGASCNYVVGYDGSIGLCVEEKDRSWCSSSKANDHRAITIETASGTKNPYEVTEKALNALIDLVTDICRRNGKTKILWFADKKKTLAYNPKPDEMVMTVHRWFAKKACPGDYLYQKHTYIAEEVNKRLTNTQDTYVTSPNAPKTNKKSFKVKVLVRDLNYRSEPSMNGKILGVTGKGTFTIVEEKDGWGKLKSGAGWIYLNNAKYVKGLW